MSKAIQRKPSRRTRELARLRARLGEQLLALETHEAGVRRGADPEDLKRFRIAARRARALIRLSRPLLSDRLVGSEGELRWLGGVLGPARDLDVLLARLRALDGEAGADGEAVIALLEHEREVARRALLRALASTRYSELRTHFAAELESLTASAMTSGTTLGKLAKAELERLRKAHDSLAAVPDNDELHSLRIKVKRARYATELAAPARSEELLGALKGLQDVIGTHQDSVVAEQQLRSLAQQQPGLGVGKLVDLEHERQRQARLQLPHAWKRVRRAL